MTEQSNKTEKVRRNGFDLICDYANECRTPEELAKVLETVSWLVTDIQHRLTSAVREVWYHEQAYKEPFLNLRQTVRLLESDRWHLIEGKSAEASGATLEDVMAVIGALDSLKAAHWGCRAASRQIKPADDTAA